MTTTAQESIAITPRDIQILLMVYSYDKCSIQHIAGRFFGQNGVSRREPSTACYRRIARLISADFLTTHRLPSWTGVGSGKALLGLGPKGRRVLAEHLGLSRSELRRLRQVHTPYVGKHHLAVCDFRLELTLACERSALVTLADWISERQLRLPPIIKVDDPRPPANSSTPPKIALIADGAFTLRLQDGSEQGYLLEMDLGTIPGPRIQAKLRGYLAHAKEESRPILWVLPDEQRLEDLRAWGAQAADALPGADPTIFWLTTGAQILRQGILSPIWQIVSGPDAMPFVPEAARLVGAPAAGQLSFQGGPKR